MHGNGHAIGTADTKGSVLNRHLNGINLGIFYTENSDAERVGSLGLTQIVNHRNRICGRTIMISKAFRFREQVFIYLFAIAVDIVSQKRQSTCSGVPFRCCPFKPYTI